MKAVIVDIDGTLSLNEHRAHHLHKEPRDWDTYNSLMHLDPPNTPIIDLVNILAQHYKIVLCTGRESQFQEKTLDWLIAHNVPCNILYMRPTGSRVPDYEIKKTMYEEIIKVGYQPLFVIEDRSSVCKMWRELGLVCLQCAPGDF